MLIITALKAIFSQGGKSPACGGSPAGTPASLALSPLAFPAIVRPHGIGVLIIFVAYFPSLSGKLTIMAAASFVLALDLLAMLHAQRLMALIGMPPLRILGAVFGVLQVALGFEMIVSGIMKSGLLGAG